MTDDDHHTDLIVVEGPIGVGKTSLAHRLANTYGAELLLEQADENPFLGRFYENRRKSAFSAQLYFLLQRNRQWNELHQADMFRPRVVADFMPAKDQLFARLNLDEAEFDLYEQVKQQLLSTLPKPDLVVYLQAPVSVLMQRVKKRARSWEKALEAHYLEQVCEAYTEFFYYYEESPLLIVNAAEINPLEHQEDFELLLRHINEQSPGRRYLNPASLFD